MAKEKTCPAAANVLKRKNDIARHVVVRLSTAVCLMAVRPEIRVGTSTLPRRPIAKNAVHAQLSPKPVCSCTAFREENVRGR